MAELTPEQIGSTFLNEVFEALNTQGEVTPIVSDGNIRFRIDGDAESLENRGELISALSLLTSRALSKSGERFDVVLDFGGRHEARASFLKEIAQPLGQVAKDANQRIFISDLSSVERRIIHHALVDLEGVDSRSDGRRTRRLIIEPSPSE